MFFDNFAAQICEWHDHYRSYLSLKFSQIGSLYCLHMMTITRKETDKAVSKLRDLTIMTPSVTL